MVRTRRRRLRSGVKLYGALTIHVFEAATGRVLRTLSKHNTIVDNARDIVRALLAQRALGAGGDPVNIYEYSWGSMRFGTSGTAPTPLQGDLLAEVPAARKELADIKKVNGSTGEITLSATLESGDANGSTLREAGIFTRGPGLWSAGVGGTLKMFSRQAHPAIEKTSAIRLEYTWVIQFTA
jgi:hypothetical protein